MNIINPYFNLLANDVLFKKWIESQYNYYTSYIIAMFQTNYINAQLNAEYFRVGKGVNQSSKYFQNLWNNSLLHNIVEVK